MSPTTITIIIAFLSSAGLFSLITFLIQRHDNKNDAIREMKDEHRQDVDILRKERDLMMNEIREMIGLIMEQTAKNEKDNVRTQLLLLMADYPDDTAELMRCAEHYFKDLEGNWYLTPLFAKYLSERGIAAPTWLTN